MLWGYGAGIWMEEALGELPEKWVVTRGREAMKQRMLSYRAPP